MRLPFPERVPLDRVAVFAGVLFAVQIFEGTDLYFSFGCAAFVLIAAVAFNTAGGLTRMSGAYVFFYSLLVVIIGLCYKAYLGEPANSNLVDPNSDIAVYVGGITAMLGAVIVSRRFSRKIGLLQNLLKESGMYRAAVGCIVFGLGGQSIIGLLGENGIALQRIFLQINQLIPLGIIIGVMYEIRHSRGTRSISLPITFAIAYYFFYWGLLGFSKQGMLTPLICWALPICALRYRLSGAQMLSCVVGVFIIFYYLVPYAQYGRNVAIEPGFSQQVALSARLLEHPNDTRKKYQENTGAAASGYYNTAQGFWDRLQFISVDDGLINVTDQGKVFGLWPIKACFLNAIPHIIWPDKPDLRLGNTYTHEFARNMPEEDTTTGISYSATAEAYHWAKWVGVFIAAPLIWILVFLVFDLLFGDLRTTPWGLLVIAELGHTAPEGMLSGLIGFLTFGVEALLFCAVFATYVAPHFATLVLGPNRSEITRIHAIPASSHPSPT